MLNEDDYLFIKNNYLEKEKELCKKESELEKTLFNLKNNLTKENKYLEEFLKFKNINILTKDLIKLLVKEILVYEDNTIQITFNYMDEYSMLLNEMDKLKYDI